MYACILAFIVCILLGINYYYYPLPLAGYITLSNKKYCGTTETEMWSFWRNFRHWLHRKLSLWQFPVQPVTKMSSKDYIYVSVMYIHASHRVALYCLGTQEDTIPAPTTPDDTPTIVWILIIEITPRLDSITENRQSFACHLCRHWLCLQWQQKSWHHGNYWLWGWWIVLFHFPTAIRDWLLFFTRPLSGESTGVRWIPLKIRLTKGQLCGKRFHVMTSSWEIPTAIRNWLLSRDWSDLMN